tara:strand:+ start:5583 stop:6362 length:780 start_codon:yes stop_codon:yes gene_type:complete
MKFFFVMFSLCLISVFTLQGQNVQINGQIINDGDLEGIHIINKTAYRYATTDAKGFFTVQGKLSDSLYFSSIQHQPKTIVLSAKDISSKTITVTLLESINELEEVVIGTLLTGDLNADIGNSDAKRPLDFYDLGIPGYTGPRMNLVERRLYEANHGKLFTGLFPNFYKLLNMISGRTKMLKKQVKLEKDKSTISRIKETLGPLFFSTHDLNKDKRMEFYYFCADSTDFQERCLNRSDVEILEYLDEKLPKFKSAYVAEN